MLLSYQKNGLLSLLAQFEAKLFEIKTFNNEVGKIFYEPSERLEIISRNIQSVRKQINKL